MRIIIDEDYQIRSEEEDERYYNFITSQRNIQNGLRLSKSLNESVKIIESNGYECALIKGNDYKLLVKFNQNRYDLNKLFKITENIGWICTKIRRINKHDIWDIKYRKSNLFDKNGCYDETFLMFEPKFDVQISTVGIDYLYYVVKSDQMDDIRLNGLKQIKQQTVKDDVERLFLTLNVDTALKFNKQRNKGSTEKFSLLQIKVDEISWFLKIYRNPNFYNDGCYTLNTIPYSAITIFKEFDLDY